MSDLLFKQPAENCKKRQWTCSFFVWVFLIFFFACLIGGFFAGNMLYEYVTRNEQSIAHLRDVSQKNAEDLIALSSQLADLSKDLRFLKEARQSAQEKKRGIVHYRAQLLSQISAYVSVAKLSLIWSSNYTNALSILQTAQRMLQESADPSFDLLDHLLTRKIAGIQSLSSETARSEILVDLDRLKDALSHLHLVSTVTFSKKLLPSSHDASFGANLWERIKAKFHDVVRIYQDDGLNFNLLSAEQERFLRAMLKVHSLSVHLALVTHDEDSYRLHLQAITHLVRQYYVHDSAYQKVQVLLSHLLEAAFVSSDMINMSDIDHAIEKMRTVDSVEHSSGKKKV